MKTTVKNFKDKIFSVINPNGNSIAHWVFETFIIILILVNVVFALLETGGVFNYTTFNIIDYVFVSIFILEYILRIWTADLLHPNATKAGSRAKFIFSPMGLIDLFAILPSLVPALPGALVVLRLIRVLRIFRLLRPFTKGEKKGEFLKCLGNVLKKRAKQLVAAFAIIFIFVIIAATMVYVIESPTNPAYFGSVLDAIWWTVITILTIGFGDVVPITVAGRILGIFIAFSGVLLVAVPTGIISAGFVAENRIEHNKKEKTRREDIEEILDSIKELKESINCNCPHCGKNLIESENEQIENGHE